MNVPPQLERHGDIGICRPTGEVHLSDAVGMVTMAIAEARRQQMTGLLFVANGLTGFGSPSIGARHAMVREWANAAGGLLKVAMVIPAEFADPDSFGVIAARNFGMVGNRFTTEAEALEWLLAGA